MNMPERSEELAEYNDRTSKGIVHTRAYQARMAQLQSEFDEWQARQAEAFKPIVDAAMVASGGALVLLFGQPAVKQQVHVFMDGKMGPDAAAAMRAELRKVAQRASGRRA